MSNITSITRRARLIATMATALGAIAFAPAGASAATTWFGSSLNHSPANAGSSCNANDPIAPMCTHVGSFYPGTSGHAKATTAGTITRIKVRAEGAMTMKFKVVRVRNLAGDEQSGQAKVITVGPTLNISGPTQTQADDGIYPVESLPVHIKVHKGDELAVDTNNNQAEYCSDGTPGQLTFSDPFLKLGQGFRTSNGVDDCLLLVQAVVRH